MCEGKFRRHHSCTTTQLHDVGCIRGGSEIRKTIRLNSREFHVNYFLAPARYPPGGWRGGVGDILGFSNNRQESWDFLAQVMIIGAPQAPPTQRKILDSKCSGIRLLSGSVQSSTVSGTSNTISSALFCLSGSRRHHSAFAFARESYREVPDGTEQSETEFPLW